MFCDKNMFSADAAWFLIQLIGTGFQVWVSSEDLSSPHNMEKKSSLYIYVSVCHSLVCKCKFKMSFL